MLESYRNHVADRAALGIPPLPLSAEQMAELGELLQHPPAGEEAFLLELLRDRTARSRSGGVCKGRIFNGDRQRRNHQSAGQSQGCRRTFGNHDGRL